METKNQFIEAVMSGREIEFSYDQGHYFQSHSGPNCWTIYHEETRVLQEFDSPQALLKKTQIMGESLDALWEHIVIECIL